MAVRLDERVLAQYRRISCYNSPFPAHRAGCAVDLYPGQELVPSPVAGTVRSCEAYRAPRRPRTTATDVVLSIETDGHLARILHVDPVVASGESIEVGDMLGRAVRTGYFDPWVSPHAHLEFRPLGSNVRRASGGLPIDLGIQPVGVEWGGTGTVVELGPRYAVLDEPTHPAPGDRFAGIAADGGGALDGGLPHYETGWIHGSARPHPTLFETPLGTLRADESGRPILPWKAIRIEANGTPIRGLSCLLARDGTFGARLIDPPPLDLGEHVRITCLAEDNAEERSPWNRD